MYLPIPFDTRFDCEGSVSVSMQGISRLEITGNFGRYVHPIELLGSLAPGLAQETVRAAIALVVEDARSR